MSDRTFHQAAVIGTGMMGPGSAVALATHGVAATILSRSEQGAAAGLARALEQVDTLAEHDLVDAEKANWARENLHCSTDLDAVAAEADIVIESAPEDMALKQDLFARLDRVAKPDAILTTNTSSLSINEVASKCAKPERVLTTHFWNPPYLMPLVEIVRGDRTSDETVADTKALLERCGKSVVVVQKDRPGQLGNRLQHAMVREAIHIVAEGIASAEDVDTAVKTGFGLRFPVYGLFEHQDAVGLDLVQAIQDYTNPDLAADRASHPMLNRMVADGELGVKSGKGFLDWSKHDWDEVRERRDRFILEFLKSRRDG